MARGRRGRASRRQAIQREIDLAAKRRQAARRRQADHPRLDEGTNDVARLTADLNGREHVYRSEGLFHDLRNERSGEIPAGFPRSGPAPHEGGGMAR